MELTAALDKCFAHTHGVLLGVRPEHLTDPTPCAKWTVKDLLEHMIGVVAGLGAAAAGTPGGPFHLGADPAAQFREAADSALAAWNAPDVMERIIEAGPGPMPGAVLAGVNLLDTTTHAWDLAVALGRPPTLPDDVALAALEQSHRIVTAEIREGRFDPEVPAPAGADPTQRLVAFLGRTP